MTKNRTTCERILQTPTRMFGKWTNFDYHKVTQLINKNGSLCCWFSICFSIPNEWFWQIAFLDTWSYTSEQVYSRWHIELCRWVDDLEEWLWFGVGANQSPSRTYQSLSHTIPTLAVQTNVFQRLLQLEGSRRLGPQ